MPKLLVTKAKTSKIVDIFVLDSSSAVGGGLTGLVYNTASLTAFYKREGDASMTQITLATATAGTWATGGFIVIDATNAPGSYELHLPDAAIATGADSVFLYLHGATNMAPVVMEIQLNDFDLMTATQPVNAIQISGDATAADNLESQFDLTGLVGDTFPSTQAQVGAIAGVSFGGFPTEAEADNTGGAIKGISFLGIESSGTFVSTDAEDGVYHNISHIGNAIDIIYQYDVQANRVGFEVSCKGFLNSSNDVMTVQAYDFIGAAWDTRGLISGQNGSTNITQAFSLLSKHTGTVGADSGIVLVRFTTSGQTNPSMFVDELLVIAAALGQSAGYASGRIYINTALTNTNVVPFVDGTADNPVSTLAAAVTLSGLTGLTDFHMINGSSITLAALSDNYSFFGNNWTLALGGQSIDKLYVEGADVSGVGTALASNMPSWKDCHFEEAATIPPSHFIVCGFGDTLTLGTEGDFFFERCHSMLANASSPIFDFGSGKNASNLHFRAYSGGVNIKNMGQGSGTYNMSLEGNGQLIIDINSTGGNVNVRGNFELTNNGAVTITRIANFDHALDIEIIKKITKNRWEHNGTTVTVYDDDATTPLFTFTPKNKSGTAINSSSYGTATPAEHTAKV